MQQNPTLYTTDSRFLNSPVEEKEEEEEVGLRPLRVKGRPIDKGSVDATQGQRLRVVEKGENLGQDRIIESHAVGPEVQGISPLSRRLSRDCVGGGAPVNFGRRRRTAGTKKSAAARRGRPKTVFF